MEVASYAHYDKMNIRSFEDMNKYRNDIATLREISKFREDGNEVVAAIFAKSMDRVRVLTGVKNWIGLDGMKFFINEVMYRYAKPDPFEIQLTPVDIQMFCHNIASGEYGELYENISVPKLLSWLEEYVNKRVNFSIENKKRKEEKKRREEESEINPEGLLLQAKAYGRIHRKHIAKRPKLADKYYSIDDYISRNDVDKDEFWNDRAKEFEKWMDNVAASSDAGIQVDELDERTLKAFKRMYLNQWIHKQNEIIQ